MTIERARTILKLDDTVPDEKVLEIINMTKMLARIYIEQMKGQKLLQLSCRGNIMRMQTTLNYREPK